MPSDIEVIRFKDSGNNLIKGFTAPFTIKLGTTMSGNANGSVIELGTSNSIVATSRNINTTYPLAGGGNLASDLNLSITPSSSATIKFLGSYNNGSPEWAEIPAVGSMVYVAANNASDIAGYLEAPTFPTFSPTANATVIGVALSDEEIIEEWATHVNQPGATGIAPGMIDVHLHANRNVGTGARVYCEIYQRYANNAETLLFTTEDSPALGVIESHFDLHAVVSDIYPFLATDRLVFKVRAHVTQGVPTVTIAFDGDTASRFQMPTSSIDATNFVPTSRNINTTAPLTGGNNLTADLTLALPAANASANGHLTSTDWNTFNSKQATITKGNLTATSPILLDQTREVIGGAAVISLSAAYTPRERLSAPRSYYVRTDGSDSNDGSANDAAHAFLTIQRAITAYQSLDCNGENVTINVADGTYTSGPFVYSRFGPGDLYIIGNVSTPANCKIQVVGANAVHVTGHPSGSNVYVKGFQLKTTTSGVCIAAERNSVVYFEAIDFDTSASYHIFANGGSLIIAIGAYTISGGAVAHIGVQFGGIVYTYVPVTISNTPNFTWAFVTCIFAAYVLAAGTAYTGNATGSRYYAEANSIVSSAGNGANFFPGNSAGAVYTGAQYL